MKKTIIPALRHTGNAILYTVCFLHAVAESLGFLALGSIVLVIAGVFIYAIIRTFPAEPWTSLGVLSGMLFGILF